MILYMHIHALRLISFSLSLSLSLSLYPAHFQWGLLLQSLLSLASSHLNPTSGVTSEEYSKAYTGKKRGISPNCCLHLRGGWSVMTDQKKKGCVAFHAVKSLKCPGSNLRYSNIGCRRTQEVEHQPADVHFFKILAILFLFHSLDDWYVRTWRKRCHVPVHTKSIEICALVAESATRRTCELCRRSNVEAEEL